QLTRLLARENELRPPRGWLEARQHQRERLCESERLFDFPGRHVRILPVLEGARALMFADELDEGRRVRFPIRRESFELLEDRVDARGFEQFDRVLGVLVEIRIENALIHEVLVGADIEQYPPEVMQLEWGQPQRIGLDGLLNPRPVGTDFIQIG